MAIPDRHLVADVHQPGRDIGAHGAEARYPYLHSLSLRAFADDDRRSPRGLKAAHSTNAGATN
jgi:hypothetical protein